VTINSTPSFTPSSTSTSEEYTNQIEEVEPEPYLEKEQSEIAIPMSDEHENNRYFLLSHISQGNIESIIFERVLNTMYMGRWKLIVKRIRSESFYRRPNKP
jgi:hypothetical protein